ncbi:hypothetical protein AHY58_002600 [Salmonella enterica subsp. enterica]|nr:hypothetical protein [Salmonella enterica subsp. enterica serovar Mikawasima]EEC0864347.1 hypothetical protein [Salmonella enterica subsp. enterica serovar Mikawasima]EGZ4540454.1 hypothetical protein [Salmonella enterica subsp. enterica serovar Mikawasima]
MKYVITLFSFLFCSSAIAGFSWHNSWGVSGQSDTYSAKLVREEHDENGKVTKQWYDGDSLRGGACDQAKARAYDSANGYIDSIKGHNKNLLSFRISMGACQHQGERGQKPTPYIIAELVKGSIMTLQYDGDNSSPSTMSPADTQCAAQPPFSGSLIFYGKTDKYTLGLNKYNGCVYQAPKDKTQCGYVPGSQEWCLVLGDTKWTPILSEENNAEPDPCDNSTDCGLDDGGTGGTGGTGGSGGDDCGSNSSLSAGVFTFYYSRIGCENKKSLTEKYDEQKYKSDLNAEMNASFGDATKLYNQHTEGVAALVNGGNAFGIFSGVNNSMSKIGSGATSPLVNNLISAMPVLPAYRECKPLYFFKDMPAEFYIDCEKIEWTRRVIGFLFYCLTFLTFFNTFTGLLRNKAEGV